MSGPYGVTSITVVIPGNPPSELLPNGRKKLDFHKEARLTKQVRHDAMMAALAQRNTVGGGVIFDGPVEITERVVWAKGRRRCDLSAVPTFLKACEDALQDAQIIRDDSQVVRLTVLEHGKDKQGPGWVELVITEATR